MNEYNIPVSCLVDRYWNTTTRAYSGTTKTGTLIGFSVMALPDDDDRLSPVGIVLMADNTFENVPLAFIQKTTIN